MVLHVAAAALGVDDERVVGALALELAQHGLVRAADGVDEGVQPAAVGHAEHDLVGAALGSELDRLVEHRHERVEPLERELLLAEERAPQVLLEPLDLRQAAEEGDARLRLARLAVAARLDRLPEPDALRVVGDVLDLVGDRPRVDLAQAGERLEQRLPGDREPEQPRGDPRLELRGQRRMQARLVERRVAHRLRPERIEARREVAVHAIGLDQRHRSRDPAEELGVDRRRRRLGGPGRLGTERDGCGWRCDLRVRRRDRRRPAVALEDPAPLVGDACGRVEVVRVQLRDVGGVQPALLGPGHVPFVAATLVGAAWAREAGLR